MLYYGTTIQNAFSHIFCIVLNTYCHHVCYGVCGGCVETIAHTCASRVPKNKCVIKVSMEVSHICAGTVFKEAFSLFLVCFLLFDYQVICFMILYACWTDVLKILILQTTYPHPPPLSYLPSLVLPSEHLQL